LLYIPEKFRHLMPKDYKERRNVARALVSFVDLAPTVLSLAGVGAETVASGGMPFWARAPAAPQRTCTDSAAGWDERYDMVRSVRDERYVYVRNIHAVSHLRAIFRLYVPDSYDVRPGKSSTVKVS
jgi:uncharacterized sulfatase